MVGTGLVTIDDMPAETDQRVHRGQRVAIRLLEPPDKLLAPESISLDIVYEDPWLLVIDKPVGLVAHPVGGYQSGTLSNAVQAHLDQQTVAKGILRPGIVHRLDRMTSGLIVVTKDHLSHRRLSLDFQVGRPSKSYLALIEGEPEFEQRVIDLAIGHRPGASGVLMSAKPDALRSRSARTDVVLQQRYGTYSLVECLLQTGRSHQIRVHLAEVGHPILGDEFYGPCGAIRNAPRLDGEAPTDQRHALHASRLSFQHPVFGTTLEFSSQPPVDFWELVEFLPAE